eukprot:TRINITY_DN9619_c0_g1_i1.p1 TRINITY_DN9619_c0_g1~~TRINITY_DN9619_c0_g1_i1.p1  ORF type:complete len:205 (+),score=20.76 TRINITY_DN9619_c0_g1_i1:57-617(+)
MASTGTSRPAGTDGTDFGYRMQVDKRYVAASVARKNLHKLITMQTAYFIIRALWPALLALQGQITLPTHLVAMCLVGASAGLVGTFAAKGNSRALLQIYVFMTAVALGLCATLYWSGDYVAQLRNSWSDMWEGEVHWSLAARLGLEACQDAFGSMAQSLCIFSAISLLRNMAPKKERAFGEPRKRD